jgi:hypothetical protein
VIDEPDCSFHSQPERLARRTLRLELPLDHDLRRDPRVIGAGEPERVVAEHAVIPGQRVHDRLVESVAHVEHAGHVRWRKLDAESRLARRGAGLEVAFAVPVGIPARLDRGGVEGLGEFHWIGAARCADAARNAANYSGPHGPTCLP